MTTLGLALGLPLSLLGGRLIASQLYKTNPYSLAILLGAGFLLLLSALLAGLIPARKAASVDPMQALRAE
jgi:ABC-type antimicrobial peptide transport system permease subunit